MRTWTQALAMTLWLATLALAGQGAHAQAPAATLPPAAAALVQSADPSVAAAIQAWQPVPTRAGTLRFAGTPPGGQADVAAALMAQRLLTGQDPPAVQVALVRHLQAQEADGGDAAGYASLWQALWAAQPALRVALLGGLEHAHDADGGVSLLTAGLQDADAAVRLEAARVSGYRREAALSAPLQRALADDDAGVRRLAARSLGWRMERGAWEALRPLLRDPQPEVRLAALRALQQIDATAARALPEAARLRQDADARVARLAHQLLDGGGE